MKQIIGKVSLYNMKKATRILSVLTAIVLMLSLFGCLVPKSGTDGSDTASPTAVSTANGGANSLEFDGEAIAIELGDVKIPANDVAIALDNYLSMFAYYSMIDEELIADCMSMVEDELVQYYLPLWKANELGITLDAAQEAEAAQNAENEVEEERDAILLKFAHYYADLDEDVEDASLLTEEQRSIALEVIEEQLAEMFYEGFTFDDYLAMERESYLKAYRIDALVDVLKAMALQDPISDEQIDAWYETTLEAQKAKYADSPLEYYYDATDYRNGMSETPVLYVPDGYLRVQVIEVVPEGEPDDKIAENATAMRTLEAEYGALLLNGGDAERQTEIEEKYAALKAENDALEEAYYGEVRKTIEAAYTALQGGMSFEDAMQAYNANAAEYGPDERLIYIAGVDTHNGEIANLAKTLEPGTYSEPILLDGAYVIVKLVEVLQEGPVDRAALGDKILAAAKAALAEDAWEDQFDAWLTEAREIVVYHRETYDMLGDEYLY